MAAEREPSKIEQKMNLYAAFTSKWCSHRQPCARLKAEMRGEAELPECTCGYFDAVKKLQDEINKINKPAAVNNPKTRGARRAEAAKS